MQLPAPAKINRFLRVCERRADGYHELKTQFQFLQLADTLHFAPHDQAEIARVDRHTFSLPAQDLSVRAAQLLQAAHPQTASSPRGVTITLHKIIPPGSGLGGGSSNAATTLLALNHLWKLGMKRTQLAELGLQLGADVPLFIHGRAATAHGIGEVLTPPKNEAREQWLCLCVPAVPVSTAKVFAAYADARTTLTPTTDTDHTKKAGSSTNDLEATTVALYPQVGEALARFRQYANAQMSGSGGALYALFNSRVAAEKVAAQLPAQLHPMVTKTCNRHPLLDFPDGFAKVDAS